MKMAMAAMAQTKMNFKPKDIIAAMCVAGYFVLKVLKVDGMIDGAFMLIIGYYFTKRQNGEDKGK